MKTTVVEDQIYEAVTKRIKSKCARLRVADCFYIQPEDENDIDVIIAGDLSSDPVIQTNSINVDPEVRSLTELAPPPAPKETTKVDLKTMKAEPDVKPPAKEPREEDKVPPQVYVPEKPTGDFDTQVMAVLQSTTLNPRAAPPEDFFMIYSDASAFIPIFVLYLFVLVIIKTAGALFS